MTLARVFDKQVQIHDRTRKAVEETLRICRNQNVLKNCLAEEETANIMFTLLDEEKAKKFWEEEIRQESEAIGERRGKKVGEKRGESRLSELMTRLKSLGRIDDAFKAASDEKFRKKMYKELNIQ